MADRVTATAHAWQSSEAATAGSSVPAAQPKARTIRNRPGPSSRAVDATSEVFEVSNI
jgi:hypothetical protein